MSDVQDPTSHRTFRQRVRYRMTNVEPGRPSRLTVILLYVLLAFLIFVDYTILTQAFVIIQASQSTRGNAIGAGQALVVLAVSLAAVFLPHVAAWGLQRRSMGILAPYVRWMPWAAIGLWTVLVLMVTFLRLLAANTPVVGKVDHTAGAAPAATTTTTTPFSPASLIDINNPAVVLAYFMLLVLLVSATMAFLVAVVAHNPLRSARHASTARLERAEERATARALELKVATDAVDVANGEADRDRQRYEAARSQLEQRVRGLRADVRTILAASLGNPEETSRLIRELQRGYPSAGTTTPPPKGATP